MASVDTAPLLWPMPFWLGEQPSQSDDLINGASEKSAFRFHAPKTGTITHVEVYLDAVTTTDTIDCDLFTLDGSTGNPSTTYIDDPTNNANGSVSSPSTGWTAFAINGGTGVSVTEGDEICVVFSYPSYTSGNAEIRHVRAGQGRGTPKIQWHDTGSGYVSDALAIGNAAIRYSGTVYHPIPGLFALDNTTQDNSTTERGVRFQVPFPARFGELFGSFGGPTGTGQMETLTYTQTQQRRGEPRCRQLQLLGRVGRHPTIITGRS